MKKSFLIVFLCILSVASIFADKNRFYENGIVIDTMYVNSIDGLRVRDNQSLQSKRLCGLSYRLPVKIVAIGKEEAIDGITAPWVEILLPYYEWINDTPKYGWVFGGYLSKEIPEFNAPRNANELAHYLQFALPCISNKCFPGLDEETMSFRPYFFFYRDGTFLSERELGHGDIETFSRGTYTCLGKDSVQLQYDSELVVLKMYNIKEDTFYISNSDTDNECWRTIFVDYIGENVFNHLVYSYLITDGECMVYFARSHSYNYGELGIKYGADCSDIPELQNKYRSYWDPIMKEHQNKADQMK